MSVAIIVCVALALSLSIVALIINAGTTRQINRTTEVLEAANETSLRALAMTKERIRRDEARAKAKRNPEAAS